MFKTLRADLKAIKENDPAARNYFEICLLYPGFHALIGYRIAHLFYKIKLKFIARLISQLTRFFTGIEIHPGAQIGKGILFDHGMGIVIGETVVMGDNCTIYQGVTLGGTGKHKGKRHPTIGNNVLIGAGAKILGPFTVGDNAKIAANAVVLNAVPANSTAVGIPARIIKREKVNNFDHVHTPDPVSAEMCKLQFEIDKLKEEIDEKEK